MKNILNTAEHGDLLSGWKLDKAPDGTYRAYKGKKTVRNGTRVYRYVGLGNGRSQLSAYVELYDKLCEARETAAEAELEDLDKHCPTCRCNEHA